MYSGAMRMIAIFVLALSLCTLSGAVTSVLAVVESTHASDCCPAERSEGQKGAAHCVSPECQCLSCLTIDLQHISESVIGIAEARSVYREAVSFLTSGDYRTIDYPPEVA